jgi:ABC-type branched-subunit amino acid transport system permease subunit
MCVPGRAALAALVVVGSLGGGAATPSDNKNHVLFSFRPLWWVVAAGAGRVTPALVGGAVVAGAAAEGKPERGRRGDRMTPYRFRAKGTSKPYTLYYAAPVQMSTKTVILVDICTGL